MEKILDRMERICRRWFYLICTAIFVLAVIASLACNALNEKATYDIPNGACYCPSCGTVMVLQREGAEG